jgi:hypothetical protein
MHHSTLICFPLIYRITIVFSVCSTKRGCVIVASLVPPFMCHSDSPSLYVSEISYSDDNMSMLSTSRSYVHSRPCLCHQNTVVIYIPLIQFLSDIGNKMRVFGQVAECFSQCTSLLERLKVKCNGRNQQREIVYTKIT